MIFEIFLQNHFPPSKKGIISLTFAGIMNVATMSVTVNFAQMKPAKVIWVDANFTTLKNLFNDLKKYAHYYDDTYLYAGNIAFTTEILPEYDGALIMNSPSAYRKFRTIPENVIAIMMEPGNRLEHPWMFKNLEQYSKIFSPVVAASNVIPSHGFLGWYLTMNYAELSDLQVPGKNKIISCIASNLTNLAGHRKRKEFVSQLRINMPEIDFFGKGINYIKSKEDALLPYKYSIAIENSAIENYFTEKISDCFLSYTIPIYYGCKNIGKYFPEKSFFKIDIENHKKAAQQIRTIIETHNWSDSLDAIKEARDLVLNKYSPICGIAEEFTKLMNMESNKVDIELTPVSKSLTDKFRLKLLLLLKKHA